MRPDSLELLFIAVCVVAAGGVCRNFVRQRKARHDALVKIRREEKPVVIRRARNWRWS